MADVFDDEYDPLAPPGVAEAVEPEGELARGGVEGGKIVRLIFEDGRLRSVRVSPRWRDQPKAQSALEGAFTEAFLKAAARAAQSQPRAVLPEVQFSLPELSPHAIGAYVAMMRDHGRKWREALDEGEEQLPPAATGTEEGVTVSLNAEGHPEHISIDPEWLEDASPAVIAGAVQKATQRAYGYYSPVAHSEKWQQFQLEHDLLLAGFRQLLTSTRSYR